MRAILEKKGIGDTIVNIFLLVLVISVLSGMTFLFVLQLKTQVAETAGDNSSYTSTAYKAVNATEAAGYTVVTYLPLIFLALIFSGILYLILKIFVPYINSGSSGI